MAKREGNNAVPCRQRLRILIIEDNPADAELVVAALRGAGHAVACGVTDSLDVFRQKLEQNDYDVILADYNLGSWTGMDALHILRESGRDVPFLVVTRALGDEAAVDCIKRGADDYILKDRLHRLPMAIEGALHARSLRREATRLQELIQQAKKDWERTFDTVPDPVLLFDEQCRIKRANRAAASLLNKKPAEVIGRCCYEMLHGCPEPPPNCPHQRLMKTGEAQRFDFEEIHLGKLFDVSATPVFDSTGTLRGCVHVMRDITERKRLEKELNQAQKMEAIGWLAGGVAHDFNNLLAVVIGHSEMLLESLETGDPLYKKADGIRQAGEHAAILTRQLLTFSRRQVIEPKLLDLNTILGEVGQMLERLIGEHIRVEILPGSSLGMVKADAGQLEQVILNLVLNARDAMPQGGQLTIETANVELDEAYTRRHANLRTGSYVMLAVSDTGFGMDAETQSHIFEPFFSTKAVSKGTGLGLATVYGIVKQGEGHVGVYSEPGRGTTFKIYLPRVDAVVASQETSKASAEAIRGSETILLVEDEEPVREVVRECLLVHGYTVLEAKIPEEALEIVQHHTGPLDLLLTDVVMPGESGRALADRLTALRPDLKVLYMSGYTADAIARHGLLEPGTAFIQKPFRPVDLSRKVREVLARETSSTRLSD